MKECDRNVVMDELVFVAKELAHAARYDGTLFVVLKPLQKTKVAVDAIFVKYVMDRLPDQAAARAAVQALVPVVDLPRSGVFRDLRAEYLSKRKSARRSTASTAPSRSGRKRAGTHSLECVYCGIRCNNRRALRSHTHRCSS